MLLQSLLVISLIAFARGQSLQPLVSKHIAFQDLPYQVTGANGGGRGPQSGYNKCNATTEGSGSLCQTAFVNNIADFCMWSSPKPADVVGVSEAYEVAWCTKPGHGTRIIPNGTITGIQWLYAKNYLQVVGFLDQTKVNLDATDEGGELDPHGDDEQGNPLGGVMYTNGFSDNSASFAQTFSSSLIGSNSSTNYTQVIEWVDFIGSSVFCIKACNPMSPNAPQLCQHIYDEIGCNYNALADYANINNTFQVCDSDDMTPPGVFTTAPGQTTTWFQPPGGGGIPPYTTSIPKSSSCTTYASSELFPVPTASTTATGSAGSGSGSSGASSSRSGSSAGPTATSGNNGAAVLSAPLPIFLAALFGSVVMIMA